MKTKRIFKSLFLLALFISPIMAQANKSINNLTKEINVEFDARESSSVFFKHRRGTLTVKYIDGNKGRVEAVINIKGENEEDMKGIMDAMTLEVIEGGSQIEIKTANKIVSWSSNSGLWGKRHKIVLSNGKTYNSKVDDITINAILYLPKVKRISLNNRYDDIIIDHYESQELNIDLHSGSLIAEELMSDTNIKMKYGNADIQKIKSLNLDSHDSEGVFGSVGALIIKDKYSELEFENLESLHADLHDSELEILSITGDANINDKYSEVKLKNMKNGEWNLHDSKIIATNVGNIDVTSKYSELIIETARHVKMDIHDDDFQANFVELVDVKKSKYSTIKIDEVDKLIKLTDSHDDTIEIEKSTDNFQGLTINAKYTDLRWPMPSDKGYNISAEMKYGELKYSDLELTNVRYVKDGSDINVSATAADGTKGVLVSITCHDCEIDLEH